MEVPDEKLEGKKFQESYGTMIESLDMKKDLNCRYYNPIQIFRRILYAMFLVALSGHPMLQLTLILIFVCYPVCLNEVILIIDDVVSNRIYAVRMEME